MGILCFWDVLNHKGPPLWLKSSKEGFKQILAMKVKKETLVKESRLILCSQEKVLLLIWESDKFCDGDGFSLISGFTKI